jgi:hypothetical protein
MKKLIELILKPLTWWRNHRAFNKRLEELRKRDPFIYK